MDNSSLATPLMELQLPALDDPQRNPSAIDEKRLQEITETVCRLLQDYRSQSGLDMSGNGTYCMGPIGQPNSHQFIRQSARLEYAGNFIQRRALGGVWLENNWSLNTSARFVRLLSAKHSDDLVGSDPFFACMPEKSNNPDQVKLTKQVEKKVQDEISRSNLAQVLDESIRVALIEGDRPVKLTWQVEQTQYPSSEVVMVYASGENEGDPVLTPKGSYVFPHDATVDVIVDGSGNFVKVLDPDKDLDQNRQPALPQGGAVQARLEREPSFLMPNNMEPEMRDDLTMTITHKNGLVADGLFSEDFIYDIFCARLSECPLMAHCFDAPIEELAAKYPDYYKKLEKLGKNAKSIAIQATGPQSTAGQPLLESGEMSRQTNTRRLINIHEAYYRCRVNKDDKKDSWLFIAIDFLNRIPIFAEYLGKMNMKRPPFGIVRGLESVPGRAYGVGVFEKFRDRNLAIDLWFNRLALKSSKSSSVTCFYPDAFQETMNGEELVIGDTHAYRVNKNSSNSDHPYGPDHPPVWRMNLAEIDPWTLEILEKAVQSGEVEFGIFSAADGSANDLNASGTATGIKNIERTGNVIQRSTENLMAADITELLDMAVDMVIENMDDQEAMWTEGEDKLAMLNKVEIRDLPRDVRLLLTKSKSPEGIEIQQQIVAVLTQYLGMTLSNRKIVRPTFIQILKDLDVIDADDRLPEPTDDEIAAEAQAGSQNQPKASVLLGLKGTDLAQNQKDEILTKDFGLQPAQGPVQSTPQVQQPALISPQQAPITTAPREQGLPALTQPAI